MASLQRLQLSGGYPLLENGGYDDRSMRVWMRVIDDGAVDLTFSFQFSPLTSRYLRAAAASHAVAYRGVKPKPLFGTPQQAAYCDTEEINQDDWSVSLSCWTPNDGWAASIKWNGRSTATSVVDTYPQIVHGITKLKGYTPAAHVLRFGERWRQRCTNPGQASTCHGHGVPVFSCSSANTGLTCQNAVGHGLWIGRFRGYRRSDPARRAIGSRRCRILIRSRAAASPRRRSTEKPSASVLTRPGCCARH